MMRLTDLLVTTFVEHIGNSSPCLYQSPSLGLWVMDSDATDHISNNRSHFSLLTTIDNLPLLSLTILYISNNCSLVALALPNSSHLLVLTLFFISLTILVFYYLSPY